MAHQTAIEWTNTYLPEGMQVNWKGQLTNCIPGATFNPWWGCEKVSPACKYCYAEEWDHRFGGEESHWGPGSSRRKFGDKHWNEPIRWNRECEKLGIRRKVFCASMADVFEMHPDVDQERLRLWKLIEDTPHLDWLLLTKRPENITLMLPERWLSPNRKWFSKIPKNIWFGTTIENQEYADKRLPSIIHVKKVTGSIVFLSMEPLFGFVNLNLPHKFWDEKNERCNHCCNGDRCDDPTHYIRSECPYCRGNGSRPIDWVITGGESGDKARPGHPNWYKHLLGQCQAAHVAFFFKQWGEWLPGKSDEVYTEQNPLVCVKECGELSWWAGDSDTTVNHSTNYEEGDYPIEKVGKKNAGRLLDGKYYNEMPV